MADRLEIMTPRKKKDGGTYWVNIGTAWQDEKGTQLVFDALPIPDEEGRCVARLFEPRDRDGGQRGGETNYRPNTNAPNNYADLDDEVPF